MKHQLPGRILALLVAASLLACTNPGNSESLVRTYGSVISAPPASAWQATRTVFNELSGKQASFDPERRLARMTFQRALVSVECVLHTSGGSVLRVSATRDGKEAQTVGDLVLLRIQRTLLRPR